MDNLENFYKNVKYLCKAKGIKIGELEAGVGVSKGYFSRVSKSGQKEIGVIKAFKIAEILGQDLESLINDDAWVDFRIKELQAEIEKLEKLQRSE